ncbi:uncharacterized protein G2W53_024308 [Senna tora]|uniref:Uncharacterized protein n=1 Tax=Senna tora TaxID=362788 RepID=A0A834WFC7_9FABA|nr:uncharacterized protein G2W53_024308 [Senna tora]
MTHEVEKERGYKGEKTKVARYWIEEMNEKMMMQRGKAKLGLELQRFESDTELSSFAELMMKHVRPPISINQLGT